MVGSVGKKIGDVVHYFWDENSSKVKEEVLRRLKPVFNNVFASMKQQIENHARQKHRSVVELKGFSQLHTYTEAMEREISLKTFETKTPVCVFKATFLPQM